MTLSTWQETLITSQVDGTALTGVAAATIIPAAARFTLPNNFFAIGKKIRITAHGRVSNIVTTPGTLTLSVRIGTGPVIAATSDAMQLNAVAKTNVAWDLDWVLTCRAIGGGTTANLMHNGFWRSESVVGSPAPTAGGVGAMPLVAAAPAVGTGFDSTAAQVVDLFGIFSLTGNSLTVHQYDLVALN